MLKIAITLRVVENQSYPERRDCISHDWIHYLESRGIYPVLIPNAISSPASFLKSIGGVNGILLTGGNDTGIEGVVDDAPERDRLERSLIQYAESSNLPLLGVCRGMQTLNLYYKGTIISHLSRKGKGAHVNTNHTITLIREHVELPTDWQDQFEVNSFHDHGVDFETLSPQLAPFAVADNGVIEGLKHPKLPFWGLQWHPERNNPSVEVDAWFFEIFKNKCAKN